MIDVKCGQNFGPTTDIVLIQECNQLRIFYKALLFKPNITILTDYVKLLESINSTLSHPFQRELLAKTEFIVYNINNFQNNTGR